jgi:TrmH family RNA methyltransferase
MVSKTKKLITSLQQKKKYRINKFFAEGVKGIQELLSSNFVLEHLYTTQHDFEEVALSKKTIIQESDLKKISALATQKRLGVFKMPQEESITTTGLIPLDTIRDPGNLNYLRLCDWFGVKQIYVLRRLSIFIIQK